MSPVLAVVSSSSDHTSNAFDRIHQEDPPLPARDDVGGLSKLLAVKRKLILSSLATSGTEPRREQLQARHEGSDSGEDVLEPADLRILHPDTLQPVFLTPAKCQIPGTESRPSNGTAPGLVQSLKVEEMSLRRAQRKKQNAGR